MRTRCELARVLAMVAALGIAACSTNDSDLPLDDRPSRDGSESPSEATGSPNTDEPEVSSTRVPDGTIIVDLEGETTPIDTRLFGANVPAWAGPERLADPAFIQKTIDSGATVIRMPGGSWSSVYNWLACEQADSAGCAFSGAARPSDYLGFLVATSLAGMWTVNFNGTAQEAAALVAFFNGSVDDERVIGVDRNGFDWGTVGRWADLRAQGGHAEPVPIRLWEVGNEVFGARAGARGDCASFGWEEVWTCDGELYVKGDEDHDGFVAFRDAMKSVDPSISIGAVGVVDPRSWGNFGTEVMGAGAGIYDFYVVHDYGFQESAATSEVLRRPIEQWPPTMAVVENGLMAYEADRDVPVAVTEYNLVAFQDGDTEQLMDRSINALYLADMIGQMATTGVDIANVWNVVNGKAPNGTDYGLIDADTGELNPAYHALAAWGGIGDELLPVSSAYDPTLQVSSYAARSIDGTVRVILLNKTADGIDVDVEVSVTGSGEAFDWHARSAHAEALDAPTMSVTDLSQLAAHAREASVHLQPYSITRLELRPVAAG